MNNTIENVDIGITEWTIRKFSHDWITFNGKMLEFDFDALNELSIVRNEILDEVRQKDLTEKEVIPLTEESAQNVADLLLIKWVTEKKVSKFLHRAKSLLDWKWKKWGEKKVLSKVEKVQWNLPVVFIDIVYRDDSWTEQIFPVPLIIRQDEGDMHITKIVDWLLVSLHRRYLIWLSMHKKSKKD